MKEIGGYFGLETFIQKPYYPDLVPVNTARHALIYIVRAKGIRRLWLPYFLCSSVSCALEKEGVETCFYHIGRDLRPVWSELPETIRSGSDWLYLVNYYGQIMPEEAAKYQEQWKNLILDNVQAFYQRPVQGMDTVYSCRKFFGVPDGGYAATDAKPEQPVSEDRSSGRLKHLLGRFETGSASLFYADFKENDHAFMDADLCGMSALTRNFLGAIDYEAAKKRREENYRVLAEGLDIQNGMHFEMPAGPYAYPFYAANGMAMKKALAARGIYIATLWPNVLEPDGTPEKDLAENILPLPCDQRYDAADMERILNEIRRCME